MPILYVKFLDDSTMQVELHTIDKTNFEEVHKLASNRDNNDTLADYPITEMQGCYDVVAKKIENTSISVGSQGEGWRDAIQIERLFQNRDTYLTLSYGIYKSTPLSSTEDNTNSSELLRIEETSFYIELVDITGEGRPNIEVIFKEDDVEFNDSKSLRPSIEGLGFFLLPSISIDILWNDFSDELFNNHVSQKTLNPFEFVFGFSGGHGSEQMDFTVSITQDTNDADTQ